VANYTKTTNFAVKDSLSTGNPAKAVKGVEIDAEFENIKTAITSKADSANPTLTGTLTLGGVAITATGTELNYTDGVTSNIQTQLDAKQPLDAALTSISGLTTAADKMIYTTASDTYAVTDLSSFGRSLIDDASASTARTTLGVEAAADPGIISIAGLTTAADKMIYTTNSDTYAVTDLTSFARTLLDDANASTARTTLGVETAVDAGIVSIAGLTTSADKMIYTTASDTYAVTDLTSFARTLLDDSSASTARTTLGVTAANILPSYAGNAGKSLVVNSGATDVEWTTLSSVGTVTSVDISGGTTGLTATGGPVTTSGTFTLGGTLAIANGGTGATTLTANNVILGNGTSAPLFVAPGTAGNVLTSNGTTWASAVLPAGGLTYVVKTANYTTQDKEGVLADTSGGAFTVTLPATPATGSQVVVADSGNAWGTNNLTVGRNGSTIGGLAENLICNITGASVQFVYDGSTWEVYAQIGGNGGNAATQPGNNAFTGANTFYNATGQTFGTATATQDGIIISGGAGGSSSYRATLTPATLSANRVVTIPDGGNNYTLGYLNLPAVGTKTGSYTLAVGDVGKYVQVGSGGSITIPDATFAEGDAVSIFNNTTGSITITCSITTAYIAGTNSDKATMSLATRGVATVLFISGTVCVVSGNVS